jgi:small multidrug resistance pump
MDQSSKLKRAKLVMFIAAIYNIFLGLVIFADPKIMLFGNPSTPFLLIVLKFIGILVAVYGIAYYFASRDPERCWHFILVELSGKLLTTAGFFYYTHTGELHPHFIWVNVWNNPLWIPPLCWAIYTCQLKAIKPVADEVLVNESISL